MWWACCAPEAFVPETDSLRQPSSSLLHNSHTPDAVCGSRGWLVLLQEQGAIGRPWEAPTVQEFTPAEALANDLISHADAVEMGYITHTEAIQPPRIGHNGGPPLSNGALSEARNEPPQADPTFSEVARAICAIPEKLRFGARQRAHMKIAKQGRARTACDRAVFDALLDHLNWKEGQARPGYDCLRQDTRYSRRAIITSIGRLEHDREVLVRRPKKADGQTANRYTLPALVPEIVLCTSEVDCTSAVYFTSAVGGTALVRPTSPEPIRGTSKKKILPPTPSQARGRARRVKSELPEDWSLPDEWRQWAREKAPSRSLWISSEAEKFKDHHVGRGTRWADWQRAWQNWWRQACERPTPKGSMAAPVKPLPPDKHLAAPLWRSEADDDEVRVYRADTPEFNSYITRLIREGSHEEAERLQKRGWTKERPSRVLSELTTKILDSARDGGRS